MYAPARIPYQLSDRRAQFTPPVVPPLRLPRPTWQLAQTAPWQTTVTPRLSRALMQPPLQLHLPQLAEFNLAPINQARLWGRQPPPVAALTAGFGGLNFEPGGNAGGGGDSWWTRVQRPGLGQIIAGAVLVCLGGVAVGVGFAVPSVPLMCVGAATIGVGLSLIANGMRLRRRRDPARLMDRSFPWLNNTTYAERVLAGVPPAEREALVRAARRVWWAGSSPATVGLVLRALYASGRPQAFANEIAAAAAAADDLPAIQRAAALNAEHALPYLRATMNTRPDADADAGVDVENVMRTERIAKTRQDIGILLRRDALFNLPQTEAFMRDSLQAIEDYLPRACHEGLRPAQARDAHRVLRGPRLPGDFTNSLAHNDPFALGDGETIGLGNLAAVVWRAIDRHATRVPNGAQEAAMMRYSFLSVVADCIEKDGHRVCNVGVAARLVPVLYGYDEDLPDARTLVPTPAAVLSEVVAPLQGSAPDQDFLQRLHHEARRRADELWMPHHPDRRDIFVRDLTAFLVQDYAFVTPTADA